MFAVYIVNIRLMQQFDKLMNGVLCTSQDPFTEFCLSGMRTIKVECCFSPYRYDLDYSAS